MDETSSKLSKNGGEPVNGNTDCLDTMETDQSTSDNVLCEVGKDDRNSEMLNTRKMKKDDSGIDVEKSQNDMSDGSISDSETNKLNATQIGDSHSKDDGQNSPDSGHLDSSFSISDATSKETKTTDEELTPEKTTKGVDDKKRKGTAKKDKTADSDEELASKTNDTSKVSSDDEDYDPTPKTAKPVHKWFLCKEVTGRQYGYANRYSNDWFRYGTYSSLHMVQRLELMYKMKKHDGCVNSLHFNTTGSRLASGSDDLSVVIWDWATSRSVLMYDSGHRSNVFQAKFMPFSGDCHLVSCARDGQIRLAELSSTGVCKGTRRLAQHRGAAHKLALITDTPHTFLTCGEDAVVYEVDLRENKAEKLVTCKEEDRKVPLYTIFSNPCNPYEFAIGGRDHFVRVYDKRFVQNNEITMKKFCPHHLVNSDVRANVTCLVYNYNGSEILASYNDEDIYTFDSKHSDGADYTHKYCGHRNNQTVKGVNYFGPKSDYIISGSDCSFIFFWDHDSEHIVHCMYGDEGGVVNCLEPHPASPFLATSGLDDDVKIWVPSCEHPPDLSKLKGKICSNVKERADERKQDEPDAIDGQTLWFLLQHLQRTVRRRRAQTEGQQPPDTSSTSSDTEDDDTQTSSAVQCPQS